MPAAPVSLSDFTDRLLQLTDQAAAVGHFANSTNDGRLALQAIREQRAGLTHLTDRLGIDSMESAEVLRQAKGITRAIARILRDGSVPELASCLAVALDREGLEEFSRAVLQTAAPTTQTDTPPARPLPEGVLL